MSLDDDGNRFGQEGLSDHPLIRLKAILDTTIDAIIVIDSIGTIESFNPAAERVFGYPAAMVLGQNVKMLMPDRYARDHDQFLSNYRESGIRKIIGIGREVECLRADGSIFPAELAVAEMELDGKQFFTGFLRDITERKLQHAELSQREARLKSILDTTVDGILVIDESGRVESMNPAAERMFGYDAVEIIGQNVKVLMPGSYAEQHDRYIRNYLETNVPRIIGIGREVQGRRKDGSTFPIDLAVSSTEFGGTRHFTGVVRDITDRKRNEALLQEANERLEAKVLERTRQLQESNAELEMFAHGISHDLKAPLRAVAGYAGILREDYEHVLDSEALGYLKSINNGVTRIDRLLADLLSLARLGRTEVVPVEIDLDEVVREVLSLLADQIQEKSAEITVLSPLPRIRAYRTVVALIIQNLVLNAIRYVPADRNPDVKLWAEQEKTGVHFCIQDNGEGIDEAWLGRVFEPFERLHARKGDEGSGLGLAIVKKGTLLHNGQVWAESKVGEGSTFHFTLLEPKMA